MANQEQKFFDGFMLLLGVWIGVIAGIVLFADFTGGDRTGDNADETLSSLAMPDERIQPIGQVVLLGDPDVGSVTFNTNVTAWDPRPEQNTDILPNHVLNGYQGETGYTPPKGRRLDLTDEEIVAVIEFRLVAVQQ